MGDIRTRKINQKHLNNIKMEEKIIYFMCLLMDLSILYEITEIYCIILLSLPSWERGLKLRSALEYAVQAIKLFASGIETTGETGQQYVGRISQGIA